MALQTSKQNDQMRTGSKEGKHGINIAAKRSMFLASVSPLKSNAGGSQTLPRLLASDPNIMIRNIKHELFEMENQPDKSNRSL